MCRLIRRGHGDADAILRDLRSRDRDGNRSPLLRGKKIGPMWLRIMVAPVRRRQPDGSRSSRRGCAGPKSHGGARSGLRDRSLEVHDPGRLARGGRRRERARAAGPGWHVRRARSGAVVLRQKRMQLLSQEEAARSNQPGLRLLRPPVPSRLATRIRRKGALTRRTYVRGTSRSWRRIPVPSYAERAGVAAPTAALVLLGEMLTIEYEAAAGSVASLLPAPLEPVADRPDAVAAIWAEWQCCSASGEELLDPVRAQYKECLLVVRCRYRDRDWSRCLFIWVDSDASLVRGHFQATPRSSARSG